jgi:hypothetical protein
MLFFRRRMPGTFPLCLILVLAGLALFIQLGYPRLDDGSEPRLARGALEMKASDNWLLPSFNGGSLPHEPPLPYWLTILAQSLWGENEFSVRSWAALASLGTVLVTFLLARQLFGPAVAFWSGLILVTCHGFVTDGRVAHPMSLALFLGTTAIWLSVRMFRWEETSPTWDDPNQCRLSEQAGPTGTIGSNPPSLDHDADTPLCLERSQGNWAPADISMGKLRPWQSGSLFALLGIAILAVGWIGVLLPVITWLTWLTLLTRRQGVPAIEETSSDCVGGVTGSAAATAISQLRPVWALAGLLLVTMPWYLFRHVRTEGGVGISEFAMALAPWGDVSGSGATSVFAARLSNLLIGFFPWSIVLGAMAGHVIRRGGLFRSRNVGLQLGICWLVAAVGLYILGLAPAIGSHGCDGAQICLPPLALIAAYFLVQHGGAGRVWPAREGHAAWTWISALGLAIAIGGPLAHHRLVTAGSIGWQLAALLGLLLVGATLGRHARCQANSERIVSRGVVMTTLVFGLIIFRVEPVARFDPLPAEMLARSPTPDVATYGVDEPSWVYYLGQPIRRLEVGTVSATGESGFLRRRESSPSVDEFLGQGPNRFVVTSRRHLAEIGRLSSAPLEVIAEVPRSGGRESLLVLSWRDPLTARKVFPPSGATRRR